MTSSSASWWSLMMVCHGPTVSLYRPVINAPRVGAGRADIKIGPPDRLGVKLIQVRRLDIPATVCGNVAIARIVEEFQNVCENEFPNHYWDIFRQQMQDVMRKTPTRPNAAAANGGYRREES